MNNCCDESLEYICNMTHHLYNVPVYYFDNEYKPIYQVTPVDFQLNPLLPSDDKIMTELFSSMPLEPLPVLRETIYLEKFFAIRILADHQWKGIIIVGPVINFKMTEEIIRVTLSDLLAKADHHEMKMYYDGVPVMSTFKFINLSMAMYFMLYQKKLTLDEILMKNEDDRWRKTLEIEQPYKQIIDDRQNNLIHTEIDKEKKVFDFIRLGRTDKVLESFHTIHKQGKKSVLSKTSYLRSQKNLAISLITLATRSAVEGGVFQEIAYNLSDFYILKIEDLTDSQAVEDLMEVALLDFAERVKRSKKHKYSKPINICQNHIFNHLNERITISQLAEITSLNPNYLSNLFKKEVGISISQFILKTKIEEAQNLLTYSHYTLAEISTLLNFYDQSYFAKVFKTYTGCTPKQFKDQRKKD